MFGYNKGYQVEGSCTCNTSTGALWGIHPYTDDTCTVDHFILSVIVPICTAHHWIRKTHCNISLCKTQFNFNCSFKEREESYSWYFYKNVSNYRDWVASFYRCRWLRELQPYCPLHMNQAWANFYSVKYRSPVKCSMHVVSGNFTCCCEVWPITLQLVFKYPKQ